MQNSIFFPKMCPKIPNFLLTSKMLNFNAKIECLLHKFKEIQKINFSQETKFWMIAILNTIVVKVSATVHTLQIFVSRS